MMIRTTVDLNARYVLRQSVARQYVTMEYVQNNALRIIISVEIPAILMTMPVIAELVAQHATLP